MVLGVGKNVDTTTERERERKVVGHVQKEHGPLMAKAMGFLPSCFDEEERAAAVYNEAIGIKIREGAPLASYSIDRRCLRKAADVTAGENLQALICFSCACIHPYRQHEDEPPNGSWRNIRWQRPMEILGTFFRSGYEFTKNNFGLDSYLERYGKDPQGYVDLSGHRDEFDDWLIDVPFAQGVVEIVCCPEDRVCDRPGCRDGRQLCEQCKVPLCGDCSSHLFAQEASLPPGSLPNDMMVFYAPEEIYADGGLTIMEMICASPCITSMICFSMEVKYGNMLDSTLHMQRHRVGARGNATTFPLPWESILLELKRLQDDEDDQVKPDLPRTGKELAWVVQVLLKTNDEDKRDNLKNFVHQAQVNSMKVVNCILGMKRRGHRAYMHVSEESVREKAKHLPEQGIPPELISLLQNDSSFEKLHMQKAATPVEGMKETALAAAQRTAQEHPNAVVLERSGTEEGDIQVRRRAVLEALVSDVGVNTCAPKQTNSDACSGGRLNPEGRFQEMSRMLRKVADGYALQLAVTYLQKPDLQGFWCTSMSAGSCFAFDAASKEHRRSIQQQLRGICQENTSAMRRFVMSSGTEMQDQFRPWYFGVAFAFLFKFCTGMPDMPPWSKHPRHRRSADAPRVEFPLWVRLMTRRVEQHLKRDWLLGFTMSSVLFRASLNQCRNVYSYQRVKRSDGSMGFTAAELEAGAISICQALDGKYKEMNGTLKRVNGDFTKVRYATTLNEAGKRMLQNVEHASKQLKGTMEVRKLMRYETNAGRVRRGVPIFITFSPDEKQNVLMLRLHRSRARDPIRQLDVENARFGNRLEPSVDEDFTTHISVEELLQCLPSYDNRRAIIARDGLASVEGFRLIVLLTCEYIFGLRVCSNCPDCNHVDGDEGMYYVCCQDLFGNNGYSDGGSFARASGIYISIEAQKSAGSLHAHGQLHVECLHQHTPLTEIMEKIKGGKDSVVAGYLKYKQHVCREEYEDLAAWGARRLPTESAWPEYSDSVELVSKRGYLRSSTMEPKEWRDQYLKQHVQAIQEKKQNHVHTMNAKGERVALHHCRSKENPTKCKSDFPRTRWIIGQAVVLCQGLMKRMGMLLGGKRNKLGSLHGPRNEENVNGTHPAMAAFLQTNSDVQLPYRFALTAETHADAECQDSCVDSSSLATVIEAVQCSQDSQVGYTCDYQNKRAARSCNEVKECVKGHRHLQVSIKEKCPEYIGQRHMKRLCTDAYGKGIVRSNQESINLRIGGTEHNVTSAESFHTASFVAFPGVDFTRWREAVCENADYVQMLGAVSVDWRNSHRRTPTMRNLVFLYGQRPSEPKSLWYLSPYEFMVYWGVALAKYPLDLHAEDDDPAYQAILTESGKRKVQKQKEGKSQTLVGGKDYLIKEDADDSSWVALPENEFTRGYRHDWIFKRNRRPRDPTFAQCPMPRRGPEHRDRNAAIIMTYFHPWSLNPHLAQHHIPFLGDLCTSGLTWHDALLGWFDGQVLCRETKRYVDNFLAVTRARAEEEKEGHSDDDFSDEELLVGKHNFADIVKTRMGAGQRSSMKARGQRGEDSDIEDGVTKATKDAFTFANTLWEPPELQGVIKRPAALDMDPDQLEKAFAAAKESQKKEFATIYPKGKLENATVREDKSYSAKEVWAWFHQKSLQKNKKGKPLVKEAQLEMLRIICQRVCDELQEKDTGVPVSDPLLWLLHGSPGTGKSEVLKYVKELFVDVLGWQIGLEYHMVALQAVMAELLEGDTIHHACGINPFGPSTDASSAQKASQRQADVAKRVLQWRWLFIDEISMVGAKLLAEVEMKLRSIMSDVGTMKRGKHGFIHAFGGINIVFSGDFWQLDPPKGSFLADIPTEFLRRARVFDPKPDVAHGQAIFWGSGKGAVQGVTELTECVRTEDPWLLQVQNEMRAGALSLDSSNFLHGRPTTVPGSWVDGSCACGKPECATSWTERKEECRKCQVERQGKHRVMNTPGDERHRTEHFVGAPAIFPNNDIKCEVNKLRAQIFAAETRQAITWSIAKDKPSNRVIAEKENLVEEKQQWLKRHDRDCGSLYGTLPLAVGSPMVLTDHYNRNPKVQLLRGRIGYVQSWILDKREDSEYEGDVRYLRYPPKAVLMKFYEWVKEDEELVQRPCKWHLDGMSEPGVYPIKPWPRSWFLDQRRDIPQLKVTRWQLPLGPAFAITAHGSQGQTLVACINDLQIGRGVSPVASYTSMTRIRTRHDLLIFRDFDPAIFTQGPPEGPTLLLKKLRGEPIDWGAIEEKHTPKRRCHGPCLSTKFKDGFSEKEWGNQVNRHCKDCMERLKEQGKTHRCVQCSKWCGKQDFPAHAVASRHAASFVCDSCREANKLRQCVTCEKQKPESEYPATRWNQVLKRRMCLQCEEGKKCSSCDRRGGHKYFTDEEWKKNDDERRACIDCVPRRCCRCRKQKAKGLFSKKQWALGVDSSTCYDCDKKRCGLCDKAKGIKDFEAAMWEVLDGSPEFQCKECTRGRRTVGMWTCVNKRCRLRKPHAEFSKMNEKWGGKATGNRRECDACIVRRERELCEATQKSFEQVQKRSRVGDQA